MSDCNFKLKPDMTEKDYEKVATTTAIFAAEAQKRRLEAGTYNEKALIAQCRLMVLDAVGDPEDYLVHAEMAMCRMLMNLHQPKTS
jgi:hypothetical protein